MTKQVLFMVGEVDWQYNDETYYKGEGEGVTPVKLYRTREAANAEADRKTVVAMSGWMGNLRHFGYGYDEVFKDPEAAAEIYNKYGIEGSIKTIWENEAADGNVFAKMSPEDQLALIRTLSVNFYTVHAVEVGE